MPLSVQEIRRIEAVEHEVHELQALVHHAYNQNDWERPPLPEFPGEYGLRDMTPPIIPPAALDAMVNSMTDADRAQMMAIFQRMMAPGNQPQNRPPAPLPDFVPAPPPASAQTPAPRYTPAADKPIVIVDNPNTPEARG